MSLNFATSWVIAVLLLSIRVGTVLIMTPILGSNTLPLRIRVCLVISFCAALVSALGLENPPIPQHVNSVMLAMANELFWGALLAFGLLAAFSSFMVAGRMLDMQMGFGLSSLVDPSTRTNVPLLGVALHMLGIAWFLGADVHHAVLRGLVKSLAVVPLGTNFLTVPIGVMVYHFGLMYSMGLILVGAVIVCLLMVDMGMAIASRVLPQANIFILSIPIKIITGLVTLTLATLYMQPTLKKIFNQVFRFWESVLVVR
jgi:flagellar biosynthesis protein FliR